MTNPSPATTRLQAWTIDPVHSVAEFSVKHMMVATVKGVFRAFRGTIQLDPERPDRSTAEVEIEAASIDTGQPDRDAHLRSDDFFDAERYPEIRFRSTRLEQAGEAAWRITGDLTIRDTTREIALDVEDEGEVIDAYGQPRRAFLATTAISRHEFGVRWNGLIESGGVIVGDLVRINFHVAAVRQG